MASGTGTGTPGLGDHTSGGPEEGACGVRVCVASRAADTGAGRVWGVPQVRRADGRLSPALRAEAVGLWLEGRGLQCVSLPVRAEQGGWRPATVPHAH